MCFWRVVNNSTWISRIFSLIIVSCLVLMAYSILQGDPTGWFEMFLITIPLVASPLVLSKYLCSYFSNRASGLTKCLIILSFLVVVFLGLAFYIYSSFYPGPKNASLEYIVVPLYQLVTVLILSVICLFIISVVKTHNKPFKQDF